jgi:hypothetical protein
MEKEGKTFWVNFLAGFCFLVIVGGDFLGWHDFGQREWKFI